MKAYESAANRDLGTAVESLLERLRLCHGSGRGSRGSKCAEDGEEWKDLKDLQVTLRQRLLV